MNLNLIIPYTNQMETATKPCRTLSEVLEGNSLLAQKIKLAMAKMKERNDKEIEAICGLVEEARRLADEFNERHKEQVFKIQFTCRSEIV